MHADFSNGALWFYALDADMTANVTVRNTAILGSPYSAVMLITAATAKGKEQGQGKEKANAKEADAKVISNIHLENITIDRVGTFVLEIKASAGSLTAKDVKLLSSMTSAEGAPTAAGGGGGQAYHGPYVYDCGAAYALGDLGGNEAWLRACASNAVCGSNSTCQGQDWEHGEKFCAHCGFNGLPAQ
jgi:hypothetical protein